MMTTERYQGWKSYETWAIALHIDNDQDTYSHFHGLADEELAENEGRAEKAAVALAQTMKGHFEDEAEGLMEAAKRTNSLWADLLNSALSEVDWYELAEHYIEGAQERTR